MAPDGRGSPGPSPGPSSPTRPVSEQPGRVGGNVNDPPARPYLEPGEVIRWARANDILPSRVLTYLKREHKEDFGDLRSIADIQAFGGETAERAIAYLKAAFDKASRP